MTNAAQLIRGKYWRYDNPSRILENRAQRLGCVVIDVFKEVPKFGVEGVSRFVQRLELSGVFVCGLGLCGR